MNITLTEEAQNILRKEIAGNQNVRISVLPGGCSGFKYSISVEDGDGVQEDDHLFVMENGVRVLIDPFSAQYLDGLKVDYKSTMQASGFLFDNPTATGGCGCGTSFAV